MISALAAPVGRDLLLGQLSAALQDVGVDTLTFEGVNKMNLVALASRFWNASLGLQSYEGVLAEGR
jgi:hypothetical protein